MAITQIASVLTPAASSGTNPLDSSSVDSSTADLCVICAGGSGSGGTFTLSDNKGNTYTNLTKQSSATTESAIQGYCASPTVGTGHTFRFDNSSCSSKSVGGFAFAGAHATPFDQETGAVGTTGTTLATGSVTPSVDGCVLTTNVSFGSSAIPTVPSGYTGTSHAYVGFARQAAGLGRLIQTTAAASNPTWTGDANKYPAATLAVFKPAAGGGGGGTTFHGHRRLPRMRSLLRM